MSKSREQKIEDGFQEASRLVVGSTFQATSGGEPVSLHEAVALILDAAERERPTWPTEESLNALILAITPLIEPGIQAEIAPIRDALLQAFLTDPILHAAVQWANEGDISVLSLEPLRNAVRDAGLADGEKTPPPARVVIYSREGVDATAIKSWLERYFQTPGRVDGPGYLQFDSIPIINARIEVEEA